MTMQAIIKAWYSGYETGKRDASAECARMHNGPAVVAPSNVYYLADHTRRRPTPGKLSDVGE